MRSFRTTLIALQIPNAQPVLVSLANPALYTVFLSLRRHSLGIEMSLENWFSIVDPPE